MESNKTIEVSFLRKASPNTPDYHSFGFTAP